MENPAFEPWNSRRSVEARRSVALIAIRAQFQFARHGRLARRIVRRKRERQERAYDGHMQARNTLEAVFELLFVQ